MSRFSSVVAAAVLAVACFIAALVGLSTLAQAADGTVTPLSDEPTPLTAGDPTAALFQQVPDDCTALTTGLCLETVNTWSCPATLSADAKTRFAPSYAESIANPPTVAVAYLDTHCIFERATRITPATWRRLTGLDPLPEVAPTAVPVPSFTG